MLRPRSVICRECARYWQNQYHFTQRRSITKSYLAKKARWEQEWGVKAQKIRKGEEDSMLQLLEKRGLVDSIAGSRDQLDRLLTERRVGVYGGFDPTAASLHVGHLAPLMTLCWFYIYGFKSVSLLGGATVKVGDPTGRLQAREKSESHVRKTDMATMHIQLKKLWASLEKYAGRRGYSWEESWRRELVNNNEWLNKLSVIDFLQYAGVAGRVGPMLGRETVRNRMEKGDGMSFAEFSYPLLQAWDWFHMFKSKGVQVQIGGSDQYGNIMAGMDLVKSMNDNYPHPEWEHIREDKLAYPAGFTVPLLTTSSGEKFGKSAGNAVWLDSEFLGSFQLYQFFLRVADDDVQRFMKMLTLMPLEEIEQVMQDHDANRSKRRAQHALAHEVVSFCHGQDAAQDAEMRHRMLFTRGGDSEAMAEPRKNGQPGQWAWEKANDVQTTLPRSLIVDRPFPRVLHSAGLVSSRAEGQRLCSMKGAYVGSAPSRSGGMGDSLKFTPIMTWNTSQTKNFLIDDKSMILRVGKWRLKVVKVIPDDEFAKLDLNPPGWDEILAHKESHGTWPTEA